MKIKQISLLAAAMAIAGTAAADHHGSTADMLKKLDSNSDGRLSQAEFTAKNDKDAADFGRIDANNDGFITVAEMDQYKASKKEKKADDQDKGGAKPGDTADRPHRSAHWQSYDADGDGRVSRSEHSTGAADHFSRMDSDGDGYLTADEMEKGMGHMAHDKAQHGADHGQRAGGPPAMDRSTSPPDQTPPPQPALPPANPPRQP